ncbi:hypothetical protein RHEC894_PC00004 (plasmid) [Rhizobium sp. CIAT894]|nr:hypothetical protein RHEC894_PC00004 [Rhizobium sp. CIAT894]
MQACFRHEIAARQTRNAVANEQPSVGIGKRASAGFCGGNAGKATASLIPEEEEPAKRALALNPGKEKGSSAPASAVEFCLGESGHPGRNRPESPENRAFPAIQGDRHH